jgi:hypothetical protein
MKFALALLLALVTPFANASESWSLENRPYYDPLIAGVREPQVSALFPAFYDRMPMMVKNDRMRLGWDIDLGTELPIFGRENTAIAGQVGEGQWGWGVWIPIDFHMIEDFRDQSAPIVNTDYRFSVMLKVRRGLSRERAFAARVQLGHESTHLGDEFSIHAERSFPTTFERINVSWQYLDLGGLYEWHAGKQEWTVRSGITMRVIPFRASYYDVSPDSITLSRIGPVTESKNWYDPYGGLEFKREKLLFHEAWAFYASSELRWRSVYDYHKLDPRQSEQRQASVNLIAGIAKSGSGRSIGRASPFIRFYHGVNPHGQFRNQKNFTEFGAGIRLVH